IELKKISSAVLRDDASLIAMIIQCLPLEVQHVFIAPSRSTDWFEFIKTLQVLVVPSVPKDVSTSSSAAIAHSSGGSYGFPPNSCFRCCYTNHYKVNCVAKKDRYGNPINDSMAVLFCKTNNSFLRIPITFNNHVNIKSLSDTGSSITLAKPKWMPTNRLLNG